MDFPRKPSLIDFREIEALLFDLGGTLVSMDFDWMARELVALDMACESAALARAEFAVRRLVSAKLAEENPPDPVFPFVLRSILLKVLDAPPEVIANVVGKLTSVFLPAATSAGGY